MERIKDFGQRSLLCREVICERAYDFVRDDTTVMIHSFSRVVMMLLLKAAEKNRRFKVLVTEARPACRG